MVLWNKRGYTIIELLIVMTVFGVLATAAMPLIELTVKRNKERELRQSLWEVRHALDAYKQASDDGHISKLPGASGYPPVLSILVTGVPDRMASGQIIYFLRRIPKDPFALEGKSAEQSWGLRSYMSTADQPKPGIDIFDIHSTSEQVGMNGIPYRLW